MKTICELLQLLSVRCIKMSVSLWMRGHCKALLGWKCCTYVIGTTFHFKVTMSNIGSAQFYPMRSNDAGQRTHLLPLEDLRDNNPVVFIQLIDDNPPCVIVARRPRDVQHAIAAGCRLDVIAWRHKQSAASTTQRNSAHTLHTHTSKVSPGTAPSNSPLRNIFRQTLFTFGGLEETMAGGRWKLAGRVGSKKHTKATMQSV